MSFRKAALHIVLGLASAALVACADDGSGYESGGPSYVGGDTAPSGGAGPGGGYPLGSGGVGGGGGAQSATGLPCEIQTIVNNKCGLCHGTTPSAGAPFALVTQQDFQTVVPDGSSVHQRAKARINDVNNPMPPPLQPELTPDEKAKLDAWLAGGAQYSSETCSAGTGDGGGGSTVAEPERPVDADECVQLLSYDGANASAPYPVPTGENYINFNFSNPWAGQAVQAVAINHIVPPEAETVVHHTLLYQGEDTGRAGVAPSGGQHGSDVLIAGWVPGASNTLMPNDVGLQLGGGDYTIEIHFFNSTGQTQHAAAGLEMCVTYDKRPNEAAVHWLGQELQIGLPAQTWQGTCTPDFSKGPVTILTSWPHMHLQGNRMTTVINRGGGAQETLVDEPFDFYYQKTYDTPTVLNEGDTLTTTCQFKQPMSFGTSTTEEMCYNFVVAYPAGGLPGVGLTSGVNHCLGF